ncbi:hypothetical protein L1987_00850 [Smallanthus sonchifolius]|uniref:Uncharacterized protein n=1 Tax=Smallanthus sonchifolius TaxID=185202 RepID=A0ACB9K3F7_9ASTR|nr:hypothetical protein L1987_00850 [Smallanthus sonchifolius]
MTEDIHKRMFVTCAHEDRIGNLPEQLIASILEKLPIQDAVRTSILSKNWRYRWTTMCALIFYKQFSIRFAKNGAFGRNGFIRIINHVLFFHKGPISKFVLHIPNMLLDSFQEIDQWILFLSRNGVREFFLANSCRRYELPSYLFSCLELRTLHLVNCILKPPLEFQRFPNLEFLSLRYIDFGANSGRTVIDLPRLKILLMAKCTNAYNFNIKATKLQTLNVIACPDAALFQLFHSQYLTTFFICSMEPIQGSAQVEKVSLTRMLSNLPNIAYFLTNGCFLKFYIAEDIPKWLPHKLNSLKHLHLLNTKFGDLGQLQAALCMLRNSPNLEQLIVRNEHMDIYFDEEAALSYLEASDCLDQTLNRLQTVTIIYVEGSKPELLFIKLLLDHSPTIRKMRIQLRTVDAHKRLNFVKNVMGFPRVSVNVEILMNVTCV